jgi:hypothetical protein
MISEPTGAPSRPSLALYVAAGLAQFWGLLVVRYQLSEPGFVLFLLGLTALGLWCSWRMRLTGTPINLVPVGFGAGSVLFLAALAGGALFGRIFPGEGGLGTELSLIIALAFMAALSNFLAVTDEAVLFTSVWVIAILGLAGSITLSQELIVFFFLFVLTVAFMLIHQNYLAHAGGSARSFLPPRRVLQLQALTAVATWVGASVLGTLLAIPLRAIGKGISLRDVVQQFKLPKSALTGSRRFQSVAPRLNFDSRTEFAVGLGPTAEDATEVMTVESPTPRYWRGRTYATYTPGGWSNLEATGNTIILADVPGATDQQFNVAPEQRRRPPSATLETHRFTSVSAISGSIFHATEPLRVRGAFDSLARRTDGTLAGDLGTERTYEVDSEVCTASPDELDRSSTRYPEEIRERYLFLGPRNPAIEKLATEALTSVRGGPFTRVEAIRSFILGRCIYSLTARSVPARRDPVDFFLNESREGYCDLFATALTVLCRQAGLPARIVTGFNSGTPDPEKPNLYHLTNNNRHAWTEVYFTGYGWISFDATVDSTVQNQAPPPARASKIVPWRDRLIAALPYILLTLGGIGLLTVMGREVLQYRRSVVRKRATGLSPQARRIGRAYGTALRALRRAGVERLPTMSSDEHLERVGEKLGEPVAAALRPLARLADRAIFDRTAPDDADAQEAERLLTDLQARLRRPEGDSHARPT